MFIIIFFSFPSPFPFSPPLFFFFLFLLNGIMKKNSFKAINSILSDSITTMTDDFSLSNINDQQLSLESTPLELNNNQLKEQGLMTNDSFINNNQVSNQSRENSCHGYIDNNNALHKRSHSGSSMLTDSITMIPFLEDEDNNSRGLE